VNRIRNQARSITNAHYDPISASRCVWMLQDFDTKDSDAKDITVKRGQKNFLIISTDFFHPLLAGLRYQCKRRGRSGDLSRERSASSGRRDVNPYGY